MPAHNYSAAGFCRARVQPGVRCFRRGDLLEKRRGGGAAVFARTFGGALAPLGSPPFRRGVFAHKAFSLSGIYGRRRT